MGWQSGAGGLARSVLLYELSYPIGLLEQIDGTQEAHLVYVAETPARTTLDVSCCPLTLHARARRASQRGGRQPEVELAVLVLGERDRLDAVA